ncbi:MAG: HindIII family type II restriction endonuclease [Aridibacter sp.]
MRKDTIDLIFQVAKKKDAFDSLEKHLSTISRLDLFNNFIECGVIPEVFSQNSSEEKLWAKFSDIFLSHALNFIGIKSEVLGARGNSADVLGRTENYTIVGDAKTFRLSRTAKNQKDFKITALDTWRKQNNYALLVAPLLQYPTRSSQIYTQAITRNVTLLSYTHLLLLLKFHKNQNLITLWETGNRLNIDSNNSLQSSIEYWNEIDKTICKILCQDDEKLKEFKRLEIEKTKDLGNEGILYWQNKMLSYDNLTQKEVVKLLIKAEKIESKIKTIKRAISTKVIL